MLLAVSCSSPQLDTAKTYTGNELVNRHIFP